MHVNCNFAISSVDLIVFSGSSSPARYASTLCASCSRHEASSTEIFVSKSTLIIQLPVLNELCVQGRVRVLRPLVCAQPALVLKLGRLWFCCMHVHFKYAIASNSLIVYEGSSGLQGMPLVCAPPVLILKLSRLNFWYAREHWLCNCHC